MPNEKKRFSERLNDALDNVQFPKLGGGRKSRLTEHLGKPSIEVNRWLKGQAFPPTSVLMKLSDLTKARSNWLLSGNGEAYDKDANPRGNGKNPPTTGQEKLNKEALDLSLAWMKLPKQQRDAMARVIEQLLVQVK
jgi:hypothetical protein